MNDLRARRLVSDQRARVESLLAQATGEIRADGALQRQQTGENAEAGGTLESEAVSGALAADLRDRLESVERAEHRIALGTYGKSVVSGEPIPAERLEAEPLAERTIEEQRDFELNGPDPSR